MDFDTILRTVGLVGAEFPAYKALFDQVVTLFDSDDQDELKRAYSIAMQRSDEAHQRAQED